MIDPLTAEVSYNEPYALIQHERLDFHHEQGQAKYLENPLNENREQYTEKIRKAAERGISG